MPCAHPDGSAATPPPQPRCGSSGTTTSGCRSDRAGLRTAPVESQPADAGASERPSRMRARHRRTWSVDPAHPIDGNLFNEGLLHERVLDNGLIPVSNLTPPMCLCSDSGLHVPVTATTENMASSA